MRAGRTARTTVRAAHRSTLPDRTRPHHNGLSTGETLVMGPAGIRAVDRSAADSTLPPWQDRNGGVPAHHGLPEPGVLRGRGHRPGFGGHPAAECSLAISVAATESAVTTSIVEAPPDRAADGARDARTAQSSGRAGPIGYWCWTHNCTVVRPRGSCSGDLVRRTHELHRVPAARVRIRRLRASGGPTDAAGRSAGLAACQLVRGAHKRVSGRAPDAPNGAGQPRPPTRYTPAAHSPGARSRTESRRGDGEPWWP